MLLEDFLTLVECPLGAMTSIVNMLENNIYNNLNIYSTETKKNVAKTRDMLFLLKHTLEYMNNLKEQYNVKVEEWYKYNKKG